jgi:hypothetical protein
LGILVLRKKCPGGRVGLADQNGMSSSISSKPVDDLLGAGFGAALLLAGD